MSIKPHCMGTAFPETRFPVHSRAFDPILNQFVCLRCGEKIDAERPDLAQALRKHDECVSAADLDAVAEEQRVKEETDGRE
jgi:hypothetical protein